jgi:molybdopterin-guanine dinucleotide biosynthesis protein A
MNKFPLTNLTAIILAGGQSSRMGRDKAFILFAGVPLLTRICQTAQNVASRVLVISPWRSRYQSLIPQACIFVEEIQDHENESAGPLIGFSQALPHVQTDWILLLAQDLPYLTIEILQKWSLNLKSVSLEAIAYLPRSEKGWEPLSGFYRVDCLTLLNNYINQGGTSFQGFLNQHLIEELFIGDRTLLFNCNTPEDLKNLDPIKN